MSHPPLDPNGDVSVAIVHYRTPLVLVECLESFEEYRPDRVAQVIVVDNSADRTITATAFSHRFPWAEYLHNEANLYFRRANNQAAKLARHRYLLFLNPDTRVVDRKSIALLADVLDCEPNAGMVGPMMRGDDGLLGPQGEYLPALADLIRRRFRGGAHQTNASHHVAGFVDTVSAAALLCRRDDFIAVGGFDEGARMYWEEQEFARKLKMLGKRAYYQPASFIYHRWRRGGTEGLADFPQLFRQAERLYYRQFFGLPGKMLYSAVSLRRVASGLLKVRRPGDLARRAKTDVVRGPSE